jgi:hypothetical protein
MPLPNQAASLETSTSGTPDLLGAPLESGNSVDNSQTSTGVEAGAGDSGLPEANMTDNSAEAPNEAVEAAQEALYKDVIEARKGDSAVTEKIISSYEGMLDQAKKLTADRQALLERLKNKEDLDKVDTRIKELKSRREIIAQSIKDNPGYGLRKQLIEYDASVESLEADREEILRLERSGIGEVVASLDDDQAGPTNNLSNLTEGEK